MSRVSMPNLSTFLDNCVELLSSDPPCAYKVRFVYTAQGTERLKRDWIAQPY
jgi:hypothetical protein